MEKVVLAYSGGLDTSVLIRKLSEEYNLQVIAVILDVGQGGNLKEAKERALSVGAAESILVNAVDEFVNDFISPAIKANALYEGKYPLVSALSRPLIAKYLVKIAKEREASFIAHGCTGKGNDQVRFEVSISALAPEIKVLAPVREKAMSRDEAIEYAREKNIPVPVSKEKPYSIDENLWGRTVECGSLEDPWQEPPEEAFELTSPLENTPPRGEYVEVGFREGIPVSLNGEEIPLEEIIKRLNRLGGKHGFGRVDMVENRLVGIKSRDVYEVPAALAIIRAHEDLESLTLERETFHYKKYLEPKFAELIYYGQWFSPLREALQAFFEKTQENVSGTVKLKFYKGSAFVVGRKSPYSLYDYSLATYEGEKDLFSHKSSKGFIDIFGLPLKVWARKRKK
jgi:argininosuccinate synthase